MILLKTNQSIIFQFIRCTLHQLSGNGIFSMIFHMDLQGSHRLKFFNAIVQCLLDFNELNPSVPVATFFQEMNDRKTITAEFLQLSLPNLACYLSCVPFEQVKEWSNVFPHADQFFRRLWTMCVLITCFHQSWISIFNCFFFYTNNSYIVIS